MAGALLLWLISDWGRDAKRFAHDPAGRFTHKEKNTADWY